MATFDENGNYIKTDWKAGDKITATKLNKIEESIEAVNNNDISRHVEVDARLDKLESGAVSDKQEINAKVDALEDVVEANKDAADLEIYSINQHMMLLDKKIDDGVAEVEVIANTVDGKIAAAEMNMQNQVNQGKADMEAMVAEVEGELDGLHAKDNELSMLLDPIAKPKSQIVIIGDSLSKGDEGQSFKGLQNICDWLRFFTGYDIRCNGVWGSTIQEVIDRLESDVFSLNVKYCLILVGTNDINNSTSPNTIILKAITLMEKLKGKHIEPIFISIPPRNDNPNLNQHIREYNYKLNYWCDRNAVKFVDVYSHLATQDGGAKEGILTESDNLHWTAKGAYECANIIKDFIPTLSNPKQFCRFWWDMPYDNFEFATSSYKDGHGTVATSWTTINTSGTESFSIEQNPNKVIGTDSNYQVCDKNTTDNHQVGIYQDVGGYIVGSSYRTELDIDWSIYEKIEGDTRLQCTLTIWHDNTVSYHTFVEMYNNDHAVFRPYFDCDIPLNTTKVRLEIFGMGTSKFKLKIGRVCAYRIA